MRDSIETHSIRDRTGRALQAAVECCGASLEFRVLDGQVIAARASCVDMGEYLLLGDIIVDCAAFVAESSAQRFLRRLLRRPAPTADYRRRGIGSVLLSLVVSTARKNGVSRIEGMIVEKDVTANPALFDWYQRNEFTVTHECDSPGPKVATVSCQIRR
jgi:GNAT superfamily N-acetyltransferase